MKLPGLCGKNEMMPLTRHLGAIYRKHRLAAKMSQRKVARFSTVSRSDISKFERGLQRFYFDTLERLCVPLKVRPLILVAEAEEAAY